MNKLLIVILTCSILLSGCFKVPNRIDPKINTPVSESFIQSIKSPFPPLSDDERKEDWGKEYTIALAFAKKTDLYQAITNFKRADILIPQDEDERKQEIQYFMILSYYLGQKYHNVIKLFEESSLPSVDKSFTAFHDLLIILYQSYMEIGKDEKANKIKNVIDKSFSESNEQLQLSNALLKITFSAASEVSASSAII